MSEFFLVNEVLQGPKIHGNFTDKCHRFKNEATGNCMDLAESDPADGTNVLCYPCHPGVGSNQNWVMLGA